MAFTLLALAGALAIFVWAFFPLFGPTREIVQSRSVSDVQAAVSKSIQELRTDLELHKIQQDDLDHIKAFLEDESSR
jgi:hypothetical protein